MLSDDALQNLAGRAARGDAAAFGEIYTQTARRVFGLCRHMLGPETAEDACSEVFLKVHRAFQSAGGGSYNPEHRFLPWLLSVTGHHCVDQLRRRGLEMRIFSTPRADADESLGDFTTEASESWTSQKQLNAEDRMLVDAGRDEVRNALSALPEQYRIPLVMRYEGELSYDDIAATMGLKRNHVATLIFRAKKELKSALSKRKEPRR